MLPIAKCFMLLWRDVWVFMVIPFNYTVISGDIVMGGQPLKIVLEEWVSSNKIMASFEKVKTNIIHAFEWKILSWKGKI